MGTARKPSLPAAAPAGVGRSIGMAVWGVAIVALVFFGLGMIVDAAKVAIEALTGIFVCAVCVAVLVFVVYLMFRGLPLPSETDTQNVVPEQSPRYRRPADKPVQFKARLRR